MTHKGRCCWWKDTMYCGKPTKYHTVLLDDDGNRVREYEPFCEEHTKLTGREKTMTHYNTSYKHLPRKEADEKALEDIKEYLGEEIYNNFVKEIEAGVASGEVKAGTIHTYFWFAGISGYPYHAFCRKYCLTSYREWMHSGADAVQTDENGYTI